MRVLMFAWEYEPHIVGGLGRHVTDLVGALSAVGVTIHLITPQLAGGPREESPLRGLHISRVPVPAVHGDFIESVQQANAALEAHARMLLVREHFTLIHNHDWLTAQAALACARHSDARLLSTIHSLEIGRSRGVLQSHGQHLIDSIERNVAQQSQHVITVSHFMAQELQRHALLHPQQLTVIHNAVQPPQQHISPAERLLLRERYAPGRERLIFSIGRLVYEKGFQVAIDALPFVLQSMPQTQLVLAGTGGMRPALEQRAAALGIAEHITFAGFISNEERDQLYQAADLAIFPSLYEPFGIVALEAMAAQCPVVAAQSGGLQEVVQPHETGILVRPNDPQSLAWGILHTLEHQDWAAARALNALRAVAAKFSWHHVAHETLDTYRTCAEEIERSARIIQASAGAA